MAAFDRVAPQAVRLVDGVIAATDAEADYFRGLGAGTRRDDRTGGRRRPRR